MDVGPLEAAGDDEGVAGTDDTAAGPQPTIRATSATASRRGPAAISRAWTGGPEAANGRNMFLDRSSEDGYGPVQWGCLASPSGVRNVGRNSSKAAARLRVRVQSNRLVIGELVAMAIRDIAGQPVVADTTDPTQAHRASRRPDVVVVVGSRGDGSTSAAVRTARRRWRQSFIIVLAETDRVEDGVALARQGADTWLVPDEGIDALRSVLLRLAHGERVLPPPDALAFIASSLSQPTAVPVDTTSQLTSREAQVLDCFARGLSRPDIAALLGISRATLRTHVQNILRKLGLHSIDQAAAQAVRGNLEPADRPRRGQRGGRAARIRVVATDVGRHPPNGHAGAPDALLTV